MVEPIKRLLLRVLRVPPEPHPPSGSPGSTTIFRASRNYYYYNLLGWGFKQVAALFAVVALLSVGLAANVESQLPWGAIPVAEGVAKAVDEIVEDAQEDEEAFKIGKLMAWLLRTRLWTVIEIFGLIAVILQAPVTYAMVRLDYEMRWYIITDRSMRIREGITSIREMTMTYANVQNLTIRQGPLQRLLRISDLRVRTAGGGSGQEGEDSEDKGGSMHVGYFRGVDDAHEIRDSILTRLKQLKDAGLGDPDDDLLPPAPTASTTGIDVLHAAREVLGEARALRRSVSRSS